MSEKKKGKLAESTDLTGIHDCSHTHSECQGGHFGEISIKESGICEDGIHCQGLHSRSGDKAGARLVESNVAIRSNPWYIQDLTFMALFVSAVPMYFRSICFLLL